MKKKVLALLLSLAILGITGMNTYAATASKYLPGYILLKGEITDTYYLTSVQANPVQAYLTFGGNVQDSSGTILLEKNDRSARGATVLKGTWGKLPSNAYAIYGSHSVMGGN